MEYVFSKDRISFHTYELEGSASVMILFFTDGREIHLSDISEPFVRELENVLYVLLPLEKKEEQRSTLNTSSFENGFPLTSFTRVPNAFMNEVSKPKTDVGTKKRKTDSNKQTFMIP